MSEVTLPKMKFFNQYLTNDRIKDIHMDLLELIRIASIQYSRNIYKKHANWHHIRTDWDFDYDFVNKNNCTVIFDNIRKQMNTYSKLFVEKNKDGMSYKCKEYNMVSVMLYENFVEQSFDDMLNMIIVPITFISTNLLHIKQKYAHLIKSQTTKHKSKKINYQVYNQLLIK